MTLDELRIETCTHTLTETQTTETPLIMQNSTFLMPVCERVLHVPLLRAWQLMSPYYDARFTWCN